MLGEGPRLDPRAQRARSKPRPSGRPKDWQQVASWQPSHTDFPPSTHVRSPSKSRLYGLASRLEDICGTLGRPWQHDDAHPSPPQDGPWRRDRSTPLWTTPLPSTPMKNSLQKVRSWLWRTTSASPLPTRSLSTRTKRPLLTVVRRSACHQLIL